MVEFNQQPEDRLYKAGFGGDTSNTAIAAARQGAKSGYITAIYLTLGKSFSSHGKHQSYFSASCPAPKGFSKAVFPFANASVGFQGGRKLGVTLTRTCNVRG